MQTHLTIPELEMTKFDSNHSVALPAKNQPDDKSDNQSNKMFPESHSLFLLLINYQKRDDQTCLYIFTVCSFHLEIRP